MFYLHLCRKSRDSNGTRLARINSVMREKGSICQISVGSVRTPFSYGPYQISQSFLAQKREMKFEELKRRSREVAGNSSG